MRRLVLFAGLLLASCSAEPTVPDAVAPAGPRPEEPVAAMNYDAAQLMAKVEVSDEQVRLEHVLLAFEGAERATDIGRDKSQAEALAAEVYAQALAGKKFTTLRHKYSNDPGEGVYSLKKSGRGSWAKNFADVGFRLGVGEVGVALFHPSDSKFGWHVIKRLE